MNLQLIPSTETAWRGTSPVRADAQTGSHPGAQIGGLAGRQQPAPRAIEPEARQEVPIDELCFRHLTTAREISAVKYLRNELNLPESAVADPQFQALEKKETKQAWSALSPLRMH